MKRREKAAYSRKIKLLLEISGRHSLMSPGQNCAARSPLPAKWSQKASI